MRILWVQGEARFPPTTGMFIYSQGLIERLAAAPDIDIVVTAGRVDGTPGDIYRVARPAPVDRVRNVARRGPLSSKRSGALIGAGPLEEVLATHRPDIAVIDHVRNAFVAPVLEAAGVPYAYVSHNVDSLLAVQRAAEASGPDRLMKRLDVHLTRRGEDALLRGAALITTITEDDAVAFRAAGADHVLVVPPAIEDVCPSPAHDPAATRSGAVVAGSFNWGPKQQNIVAFANAWARSTEAERHRLRIVGNLSEELAKQLTAMGSGIDVVSRPVAMQPHLTDMVVGVVPEFIGGGFKLKWFDYAAAGLAPIAAEVSMAGLPAKARAMVTSAGSHNELVEQTVRLLDDPAAALQSAAGFQGAIYSHFDGQKTLARLVAELSRVAR